MHKIQQTIDHYIDEESLEPSTIYKILLTGGALKLKSQEGKKLNKTL